LEIEQLGADSAGWRRPERLQYAVVTAGEDAFTVLQARL
jgi:hypothetical protein